jgi:hypothetical protein
MAEKIEQPVGLAAARSQMHIGDEKRAIALRGRVRHAIAFALRKIMPAG